MKVTFIVNAMLLIEGAHTKVLCDPWITFDNYSESGFYNFPKVAMNQAQLKSMKPDYIYITHTHPDHFDRLTLENFDKNTPVLVSYYKNNFTERMVKQAGFTQVIVVPENESVGLNGDDKVWIQKSAENPEVDSIGMFKIDNKYIINVNDNVFSRSQCEAFRNIAGKIDVGLIPSGAHGPWPMFFDNYSADEKQELAQKRTVLQKEAFVNYIDALKPEYVIPIAGGIVVGGDKVDMYKYSGIRPRSEMIEYAKKSKNFKALMLSEGCSFDFETDTQSGVYQEATYENNHEYMQALKHVSSKFEKGGKFYIAESEHIDLTKLLANARKNQHRWQERYGIESKIVYFLDVGDEYLYRLSLENTDVSKIREKEISDNDYEIFRMPYALLLGMLTRHYIWSNVNTQYMRFYRHTSEMDKGLMVLMNFLQL